MEQLKIILKRLTKPKVIISIISEIATILLIFNIEIDMNIVTIVTTSIFSVLITLGIISDPDSNHKGYTDDLLKCSDCDKVTKHIKINGKMVCNNCGCENCSTSINKKII